MAETWETRGTRGTYRWCPLPRWCQTSHSSLRPGTLLSPKVGLSLGSENAWSATVYTATPGIPGDSGSGLLDADGRAFGTLSTVALAPLVLSNGVGSLPRELAFAQRHAGIDGLRLARGTEDFAPPVG